MPDALRSIERADPDADAIARGYESRDFNIRAAVWLGVGFVVAFTALSPGLWLLYGHYVRRPVAGGEPPSAVSRPGGQVDAPPLQPQRDHAALDAWDLKAMHEREDAAFVGLGWRRDGNHFAVPASVVATLQDRRPATRPAEGGH